MPEWPRGIGEEVTQHLDDEYRARRAAGESHEDAMRALAVDVEELASPRAAVIDLAKDLRFGTRLLAKDRGASLVVVVTLALAIAANAIVFGFADLLILRPLPVGNAKQLVAIFGVDRRQGSDRELLSLADYLELRRQSMSLIDVAAMTTRQASLAGAGEPLAVTVNFATTNVFSTLGIAMFTGRTFLPDEGTPGHANVAILSHRFWAAHFAADPAMVGRTLTINGEKSTVVGVLSPTIEIGDLAAIDLWRPLATTQAAASRSDRTSEVFALRRPQTTLEQVNAELTTVGDRLQRADPVNHVDWRLRAMTIREATAGATTWIVLALLGVVTMLVLVVACANVATVMLARASGRRKEIAVRLALGATRARLVRQLVTEGLILGCVSGACGVALAYAGLAGFKRLSPEPFFQLLQVNGNLLAFAFALSVACPLLFGVMPALQASRPELNEDLKDGARDASLSRRGNRSRAVMLVAQVGFALAVLIVAGLVVRTVIAIERMPLGFTPGGMWTTRVRFDPPKYTSDDARRRMVDAILDRLTTTPGVTAAAATRRLPLVDPEASVRFSIVGRPAAAPADLPSASLVETLGDYTRAFAVPLLQGRMWRVDDATDAVAVVNREAVRRYWSGRSPLGDHVSMVDAKGRPTGVPIEIVGVVDNVRSGAVSQSPPPRLYRPPGAGAMESVAFVVRVQDDSAAVAPAIRDVLRSADRDLAVSEVRSFAARIAVLLRNADLILALFVGFAAIASTVAVTGVYGVTAFSVNQRRHEIGVRVALGATAASVVGLFVSRSLRVISIGVLVGVAVGFAIGRMMTGILVDTSPSDPATYVTVIALIVVSGLVASLVPASRASSIDPIAVLKSE